MRQIFENYGEALISAAVGTALFVIIGMTGMISMLGKGMKLPETSYEEAADFDRMREWCRGDKPEISCNTEKVWRTGDKILIEQAFRGRDAKGTFVKIKVLGITDRNGRSRMEEYKEETQEIVFSESGVYYFRLKAQDDEKRMTARTIALSVDARREEP